jgi:hypothetical protein
MTNTPRSAGSSAASLFRAVALVPQGPVIWGTRVPCDTRGVYIIETPEPLDRVPLDCAEVAGWLARVPTLRLDGARPTANELADRLAAFWIAGETVVYVGLAGTSVAKRVGQFYRTPLGDSRPHAGGHWLKTLARLDRLRVWWAETDDPDGAEAALLATFAARHGGGFVLPFGNRQAAGRARKPHGITGSTVDREAVAPAPVTGRSVAQRIPTGVSAAAGGDRVARISAAIQELACASQEGEIRARRRGGPARSNELAP